MRCLLFVLVFSFGNGEQPSCTDIRELFSEQCVSQCGNATLGGSVAMCGNGTMWTGRECEACQNSFEVRRHAECSRVRPTSVECNGNVSVTEEITWQSDICAAEYTLRQVYTCMNETCGSHSFAETIYVSDIRGPMIDITGPENYMHWSSEGNAVFMCNPEDLRVDDLPGQNRFGVVRTSPYTGPSPVTKQYGNFTVNVRDTCSTNVTIHHVIITDHWGGLCVRTANRDAYWWGNLQVRAFDECGNWVWEDMHIAKDCMACGQICVMDTGGPRCVDPPNATAPNATVPNVTNTVEECWIPPNWPVENPTQWGEKVEDCPPCTFPFRRANGDFCPYCYKPSYRYDFELKQLIRCTEKSPIIITEPINIIPDTGFSLRAHSHDPL